MRSSEKLSPKKQWKKLDKTVKHKPSEDTGNQQKAYNNLRSIYSRKITEFWVRTVAACAVWLGLLPLHAPSVLQFNQSRVSHENLAAGRADWTAAGQGKTPHPWALLRRQRSQGQTNGKDHHPSWIVVTLWLEEVIDLHAIQEVHRKIQRLRQPYWAWVSSHVSPMVWKNGCIYKAVHELQRDGREP